MILLHCNELYTKVGNAGKEKRFINMKIKFLFEM